MQKPIDIEIVEARMRDLGEQTISQTVSLFKGGTFALAAVLLLEIVSQPEGRLLRLALWLSSFLLALVSYNAHINSSVTAFRESVAAVVVIIVQMMAELLLFVVLTPRFADQAWRGWLVIYALFALLTAVRLRFFPPGGGVAVVPRLKPMLEAVDRDRRQAASHLFVRGFLMLATGAAVLMLPSSSRWPAWLSMGAAILLTINSVVVELRAMHRRRVMMERMLDDALAAKDAG